MSGAEAAIIAAVTTAAAATVEGYGQYQQAKQQAQAHDQNADILRKNAAKKRLETAINEDIMKSQKRREMSKMRNNLSASGTLDSSSADIFLGQVSQDNEQNIQTLKYQGMSEAANYLGQANLQNYYGQVNRQNGKNAFYMGMISGGISGAGAYAKNK